MNRIPSRHPYGFPCTLRALYNSAQQCLKCFHGGCLSSWFFYWRLRTSAPVYREVSPSVSGITWVHENGRSPQHYLPETVGAGVAIFDFDNDGWMDILLVNSGPAAFYTPKTPLQFALYRNNHDGTFSDVTQKAGITTAFFGMGVAVGDYDHDGYQDIFISGVGKCVLYHNNRRRNIY